MIMSLRQRKIKFKPRIKLNHNTDIEIVYATRASRIITIRIFFNNSQGMQTFLILINNSLTSYVVYGNGQL